MQLEKHRSGWFGVTSGSVEWDAEQLRVLAALLGAGIAPRQAIGLLQQQFPAQAGALEIAGKALGRGASLADALASARLLCGYALEVVRVAQTAGQLSEALQQLAAYAERRRHRIRTFKAQLWLPLVVLVIALMAGLILRVQGQQHALSGVLLELGFWCVLVAGCTLMLLRGLRLESTDWLSWGWRWGLKRSRLFQQAYEYHFFSVLFWPLNAGLDYINALELMSNLYTSNDFRRSVSRAQGYLRTGQPLGDVLLRSGLVFSAELKQLIESAEQAGRIAPAIEHHLSILQQRLTLKTEVLYEWLPRFYYLFVVVVALKFIQG